VGAYLQACLKCGAGALQATGELVTVVSAAPDQPVMGLTLIKAAQFPGWERQGHGKVVN
jgi:hypothetical protein